MVQTTITSRAAAQG